MSSSSGLPDLDGERHAQGLEGLLRLPQRERTDAPEAQELPPAAAEEVVKTMNPQPSK
jgi:hypothetical protein